MRGRDRQKTLKFLAIALFGMIVYAEQAAENC